MNLNYFYSGINRDNYTVLHGSQSLPRQNYPNPGPGEDEYLSPADNSYTVSFEYGKIQYF